MDTAAPVATGVATSTSSTYRREEIKMSRYGTDGKSGACRNFRDVKARNLTAKATLSPTELTEAHRINYMTSLCDILPFATDLLTQETE